MGFVTVPPSPFPPSSGKTGDIAERVTELETNVSTLQSTKAPKTDIAPAFSAETNYSVGDLVYYDGALYECTTEHTAGAWNSEHFTDTAIDDQLNAINSNLTSATSIQTLSFADSQKCILYTGTDGWRGANRIQVYGGHLVHVDLDIILTENVSDSWVLQLPEGVYPTCAIRSVVAYINKNNGRICANGNANDVIIGSFDYII